MKFVSPLGLVPHELPSQGTAGPLISLEIAELQPMDLAFPIAPVAGEPRGNGAQVIQQAPREASEIIATPVHRLGHPRLQVITPGPANHGQKGLNQGIGSCDSAAGPFGQSGGEMYWADAGTGKIQRANLHGTGVQDLIITYSSGPMGGGGQRYGIALATAR